MTLIARLQALPSPLTSLAIMFLGYGLRHPSSTVSSNPIRQNRIGDPRSRHLQQKSTIDLSCIYTSKSFLHLLESNPHAIFFASKNEGIGSLLNGNSAKLLNFL